MTKGRRTVRNKNTANAVSVGNDAPRCGLCGSTKNLTKTPCCNNWICDDEDNYVMFSFARNSCHRNHSRYTLCASHFNEGHTGDWKTCEKCLKGYDTEDYVYFGTNEYNFEKLTNPPTFEPTRCADCGTVIVRSEGSYSQNSDGFFCMKCANKLMRKKR